MLSGRRVFTMFRWWFVVVLISLVLMPYSLALAGTTF